ncbi:MAG: DUF3037 domain-containing protein [Bacteroidota bacterium]
MQEKLVYEYGVIRVIPRVDLGECLNVGVILFCKRKRFLAMKYKMDRTRLAIFDQLIDLDEIEGYLKAWDLICQGKKEGGQIALQEWPERFRWLTAVKSTIVQSSRVHPGLCLDPQSELDHLFEQYIL